MEGSKAMEGLKSMEGSRPSPIASFRRRSSDASAVLKWAAMAAASVPGGSSTQTYGGVEGDGRRGAIDGHGQAWKHMGGWERAARRVGGWMSRARGWIAV